jgi:large subunit ribosomal protein L15
MELHQLKPKHPKKDKKRIGRGGKKGTYSGRGQKGQKARAGHRFQPIIRDLIKRYPKLRGYRFKPKEKKIAIVNLSALQEKFLDGEKVEPKTLFERKIIRKIKGKIPQVKILAKGELSKKLLIQDCYLSKAAKEKIEKAGGKYVVR